MSLLDRKLVIVVSSMLAFRQACKAVLHKSGPENKSGRNLVEDRLQTVSESVLNGLFERFTELPRGHESLVHSFHCWMGGSDSPVLSS